MEHAEKVSDVTNFMYISPIVAAIVAAFLLGEISNMGLYIGDTYHFRGHYSCLIDIDKFFLVLNDSD